MLTLLNRIYPGKLKAAHLEHGIRGEASLADAEFVVRYCANIGVPCFVRRRDVVNNRAVGESVEMAGRRERYDFFFSLLEREGIPFVATAHNSGDVIETMLFNMFRGSGVKGLAGIAETSGRVVRPVIDCTGKELREFLSSERILWREDETNSENHYQRNKIRNQLLPWVRENINEAPDIVLLGLAGEFGKLASSIDAASHALIGWLSRVSHPALAAWDMRLARSLTDARLAYALRAQGALLSLPTMDRHRIGSLINLIRRSGKWRFQWSGEVEVCGSPLLIGWINRPHLNPPEEMSFVVSGTEPVRIAWGAWKIELALEEQRTLPKQGVWSASIPCDCPCDGVGVMVKVSSAAREKGREIGSLPWWLTLSMPRISCERGNKKNSWTPCSSVSIQNEADCVIIAKVFIGQS